MQSFRQTKEWRKYKRVLLQYTRGMMAARLAKTPRERKVATEYAKKKLAHLDSLVITSMLFNRPDYYQKLAADSTHE